MRKSLKIRLSILLLGLNILAFSVNYYGFAPKIQAIAENESFEIYLFTDLETGLNPSLQQVGEFVQNPDGFWPFEAFYINTSTGTDEYTGRFRGFFTGFERPEFIFYNLLILALILFFKFW
ncbi:hypothetical protein [Leeuwenhoekiella aestuarii]|uniref:hypothetical protein n=1 Tax=Leeuwenhoekiella aestuarii TaxID=2249426 RepID=UPI000FFE3745|nr:hypothetical protein [Leeuwenhoekiella aestuarii]